MRKIEQYSVLEGKTPLSGPELSRRFLDIDGRLHLLEELKVSWEQAVVEVQNHGLERINGVIEPLLDLANDLVVQIQQELGSVQQEWDQTIAQEWQDILDGWAGVQGTLDGMQSSLDGLEAAIDAALAESVTLSGVQSIDGEKTFSTPPVTAAPTAQDHVARWQDTLPAQQLVVQSEDGATLTIDALVLNIKGKRYTIPGGRITIPLTGLIDDTWHYVYASAPGSGLDLSASNIFISTTAPTKSLVYGGLYNGSARCIGVFKSPMHPSVNWAANTSRTAGVRVWPRTGAGNYFYRAVNTGTNGSTEPTWPTTPGNTVVDGAVTWICFAANGAEPFLTDDSGEWRWVHTQSKWTHISPPNNNYTAFAVPVPALGRLWVNVSGEMYKSGPGEDVPFLIYDGTNLIQSKSYRGGFDNTNQGATNSFLFYITFSARTNNSQQLYYVSKAGLYAALELVSFKLPASLRWA